MEGESRLDEDGNLILDAATTSFRETRVSTALTLRSGAIRLFGLWRPTGTPEFDNADILQAAFCQDARAIGRRAV